MSANENLLQETLLKLSNVIDKVMEKETKK